MKLIHSITRRYIAGSIAVLVLFSVAMYFVVNAMLESDINDRLKSSRDMLVRTYDGGSMKIVPFFDIEKVPFIPADTKGTFKDTLIFNPVENEYETFREFVSYEHLRHGPYKITVWLSLMEKEDLISAFSIIFGVSSSLLLLALFIINRQTTTKLFAPFYETLSHMRNFSLRTAAPAALTDTDVDEFREMSAVVSTLIQRAQKEYASVKEFSENASHELQTPLAIVRSKLDLLIQKENLDEEEKLWIETMYKNIGRLTRLNKALLLLSQIESPGYFASEELDIAREVQAELETISEIAEFNNITVAASLVSEFRIKANPVLISILIKNLLSNAVRHNNERGIVNVRLEAGSLSVENTGSAPQAGTAALFERFKKESVSDDSIGLGLAVVKEICALYTFDIAYVFSGGFHTVTVKMENVRCHG